MNLSMYVYMESNCITHRKGGLFSKLDYYDCQKRTSVTA